MGLGTLPSRQDADWWYLRSRIEVGDMAREPAHVGQPQRPGRVPIRRQRRPFRRELRRGGLGLALLHEGDEVAEPPGLVLVLVSEPLAHAQVLLECGAQIDHCAPPGQGRLNVRSASMSTFAYIRVVSWLSCRSS